MEKENAENNVIFAMRGQYIKDLSFESPNAPKSLLGSEKQPKIDMNVNLAADKIADNMYELSMEFTVRAAAEKTLFITELTYAGVFEISGVPEEKIEQIVMVDCAFMLFPFARRIVSDVTRDGGFPPLMMDPVDFYGMFMQKKQK